MRRQGFFTMWGILFNGLVSMYLGIMLSPTLIQNVPALRTNDYYTASD